MLIPYYWAESRIQSKSQGKQVTVKRWGWSDISQEDAQAHAEKRTAEALERIRNGETLRRRDKLEVYGTEDGMPIREEVVTRHGNIAITRNSYGALCLNTPNVFFADVDAAWEGELNVPLRGCLFILLGSIVLGIWLKSVPIGLVCFSVILWLTFLITGWINRLRRPAGEAKAKADNLAAIRHFSATHPQWHLRVYETPAGYRIMAMHDVFDPQGPVAKDALEALNSDKRFARMCALQSCFRARVSPKFWRIGYKPKEALPKSKWPYPPEQVQRRRAWVAGYEQLAPHFASCRFLERLGSHEVHPEAQMVRALHDELCQSDSTLPLG
jgi:hypothetical protein